MAKITPKEIDIFTGYIYDLTSIVIQPGKSYLLESRLQPVLIDTGLTTYNELFLKAKSDASGRLSKKIINAITTNETFFFRDQTPFDLLRNKIIPDLIDRRRRAHSGPKIPLRIWSAACSTGQEVYSIAMTLAEMLNLADYDIYILGTDISTKAISKASYGKYNAFELQRGLPSHYLKKYFSPLGNGFSRVCDELRSMVKFDKVNLLQNLSHLGSFDIIFCRNVAIYFSRPDKIKLFSNLAAMLRHDGAFLVGGSETLTNITTSFVPRKYLGGIYYQRQNFSGEAFVTPLIPPQPSLMIEPVKEMNVPLPLTNNRGAFPTLTKTRPHPRPPSPVALPIQPRRAVQRQPPVVALELEQQMAASGQQPVNSSLLQGLEEKHRGQGAPLLAKMNKRPPTGTDNSIDHHFGDKKSLLERIRENKQTPPDNRLDGNEER